MNKAKFSLRFYVVLQLVDWRRPYCTIFDLGSKKYENRHPVVVYPFAVACFDETFIFGLSAADPKIA
jgi:hypothetical protein